MKKTGYVVVDCTGIDLAAEEKVTIAGIISSGDYVLNAYGATVTIDNEDGVTIS